MNKDTQEIEKRSFSVAVDLERRDEGSSRKISGYAAVFDSWSNPLVWFREKIDARAFDNADFSRCILCFNHDTDKILARTSSGTLQLEIDEKGLRFTAEMPNTTTGNDVLELIRRGDISQCSFAFHVREDSWNYLSDVDPKALDERTITDIDYVYDVSPVVHPAYDDTSVAARSLEQRKEEHQKEELAHEDDFTGEADSRKREFELLTLKYVSSR